MEKATQKTTSQIEGGQPKAVISSPKFKGKWHRIAWEYFHAPGTMGMFYFRLCAVIQTADRDNLGRLRKGFPELVEFVKEDV